jgi:HlyD family secretion protein
MATFRRTAIVIAGVAAALVATAGILFLRGSAGRQNDGAAAASTDTVAQPIASAAGAFPTDVPIPVEGARVIRDTLVISVTAAGQAAAAREAKLLAQVNGPVQAVRVRENQAVAGGELLLEIDPTEYRLALDEAEAGLRRAQAQYRELTLFDAEIADSAVRAERDRAARAKSGLDQAEVQFQKAQLDLSRTKVRAPFPGRVASLKVVEGQWVRTGDELLTVVDINPIKVEVKVLEGEVGLLAPGRRAQVNFAALPGETFVGTVQTINPVIEQDTRTARVTVLLPNPNGRILPGMYARVSLEARKFPNRILVPRSAILERDRRTMLFVLEGPPENGLAKWRYVTTGLQNDSLVEIVENPETEMVRPGEIVLTGGHYTLIHDARVRLVENVRQAGGRPR